MALKPLTGPVLHRLTHEALVGFLSQSERFEARLHPGCEMVLCNEPVADLNYVTAGTSSAENGHFEELVRTCRGRNLPFLAILFPEAGQHAPKIAESCGLTYAVDFPMMVREDLPIEPSGGPDLEIQRVTTAEQLTGCTRVLATAFGMPLDSLQAVFPPALASSPGLDLHLALSDGRTVGTVLLTHHGETSGIWCMGTDAELQGRGIGRRLLSTVLAETRERGTRRFFLGATPAGFPLYEKLGFETRVVTQVWASGETGQA